MESQFKITCRANLTKLIKSADELFTDAGNIDMMNLNVLIDRIKAANNLLKTATKDAMPFVDKDRMAEECQKIFEYEDSAVVCISKLEQLKLSPCNNTVNTQVQDQSRSADGGVVTEIQLSNKRAVKLPKISLLSFNGDLHAWPQFWEQYCLHIHENSELNDSEKFCYLKSLLTGPAALIIEGLTTSQASYQDAIDILIEEYGKTEYIVDEYIQKLLSLPIIKNKNDVSALKNLYNNASIITRSLQSLGISAEHYGIMVKSILLKTIPYQMKIDFNKQLANENLDNKPDSLHEVESVVSGAIDNSNENTYRDQISKLLRFIKLEIDSLSRAQALSNNNENFTEKRSREKTYSTKNKFSKPCTTAGLLTTATEGNCLFCKEKGHQVANCAKTISIEMKKDILKKNACCFRCTKAGHNSQRCYAKVLCDKCKNRHATSMCDPNFIARKNKNDANGNSKTLVQSKPSTSGLSTTNLFTSNSHNCEKHINPVYLQTAYSFIHSEGNENNAIRLVLDGGSQMTFIKECISRQLRLPVVGIHKITIVAFGNGQQMPSRICKKVLLSLRSCTTNEVIKINAVEVPEICFDSLEVPCLNDRVIENFAAKYKLADVVPDSKNVFPGISVLIGADNYAKLVTGERRQLTNNLCALKTKFGWTLLGVNERATEAVNLNLSTILQVHVEKDEEMDLKQFWNLETIGIVNERKRESVSTTEFMRDKIKLRNNRYIVSLPWINDNVKIDSNFSGAQIRLKNLINKLIRNDSLIEYDKVMREYFENDCAELVPETINCEKQYFMPHRPVYREDKDSTKTRIVFDASAHAPHLPSLNELLHSGENLIPDLVKILLNFRIGAYALIADIEKAFLQIVLEEKERNSHSFLWFNDVIQDAKELPKIQSYRMKRVTFGVTCSPFLLVATLQKHLMSQDAQFKRTIDIISKSFYVDDLVIAVNSKETARIIFDESTAIMAKASMNLRKWCSNDNEINRYIEAKNSPYNHSNEQEKMVKKVLGIHWNTVTDEINTDLTKLNTIIYQHTFSKRVVLQIIASVYDPLGCLGPFMIKAKIIMQQIWKANLGWDEILTGEILNDWIKWLNDIKNLNEYYLPRCIIADNTLNTELHVFVDASQQAYGAVAYLRSCISDEDITCNILISKNRVAPINSKGEQNALTLPKLELTAALCGARLQKYILDNVNILIKNVFLWTDSKIALFWIRGKPARWKPYVSSRVTEVNNISKGIWRHCPGKENPADLLTRGISATQLKASTLWINGPDWLRKHDIYWPDTEENVTVADEKLIATFGVKVLNDQKVGPIFEISKYSSYEKVIRITCYVFRFLHKVRNFDKREEFLSISEMKAAERYWLKNTQQWAFQDEIICLKLNQSLPKNSSLLLLHPFLDENEILRLGGRLQESILPYENRHPIILPKNSYFTNLLIWRAHIYNCHLGVNSTLTSLRQKYWILQGRQNVKSVLKKCVTCKKLRGKPGNEPFSYLPGSRVRQANPFKICGIDFAGPLYVVTSSDERSKVYILLITCAIVRAVHLELVLDLTAESCLRALRRFIARRGVPDVIYSDNAKTFKRVSNEFKELKRLTKTSTVQDHARKFGIEWRFSVERAPWWGGFWERLVKTVKDSLKISIGRASFTFEELSTVLVEVEAIVNSRPLTYIDDDPENLLILSPSHFLLGSSETNFTFDFQNEQVLKRSEMVQKWNIRNKILSQFWKKWKNDYLQQLRSAHINRAVRSITIKKGDIVLLYEPNVNRLLWKMARVTEVFVGRDGKARACQVKTTDGTNLKRPIQLLYPMELNSAAGEDVKNIEDAPVLSKEPQNPF